MPESALPLISSRNTANPAQEKAIRHYLGPCEVLAGPGSGKTYVLIQRILHLIDERGVDPSHILVLTFSRAAALEMQQRFLTCREGMDRSEVTFGTFHSAFYQIYRISSNSHPVLISGTQSGELLTHLILRHLRRPPRSGEIRDASAMISRVKATGCFPAEGDPRSIANFRRIYEDYSAYLRENGLIDFEDMIDLCAELLRGRPEELHRWQERFRFLLVDEYQDINIGQFNILRLLAGERRNLFVVGDDDQSIYAFRGSDPSFMREFLQYYPDAVRVNLDINYRCLPEIVQMSQRVIRVNQNRLEKPVHAARGDRGGVYLHEYANAAEQFQWLSRTLGNMTQEEQNSSAVIFRTHAQMKPLLQVLNHNGILYRPSGDGGRAGRAKPSEEEALQIVIGYYRLAEGIANGRIMRAALFRVLNTPERYLLRKDFGRTSYTEEELLRLYPPGTHESAAMAALCRDTAMLARLTPALSLRYITRVIGYQTGSARLDTALSASASECGDFREFLRQLEHTDLQQMLTPEKPSECDSEPGGTIILTMHASKGLEFDTVFLPDLNEGLLPSRRSRSPGAIEEERRLFYVAMTRARSGLHLMYLRGTKRNPRLPTRFLKPLGVKDWI